MSALAGGWSVYFTTFAALTPQPVSGGRTVAYPISGDHCSDPTWAPRLRQSGEVLLFACDAPTPQDNPDTTFEVDGSVRRLDRHHSHWRRHAGPPHLAARNLTSRTLQQRLYALCRNDW